MRITISNVSVCVPVKTGIVPKVTLAYETAYFITSHLACALPSHQAGCHEIVVARGA